MLLSPDVTVTTATGKLLLFNDTQLIEFTVVTNTSLMVVVEVGVAVVIVELCVETGGNMTGKAGSHLIVLLTGLVEKISRLSLDTLSSPLSLSHKYPAPELDLVLTSLYLLVPCLARP